ncbi:hypothetical protein OIU84_016515 [Salix udensis]|uniref:Auxin response factor domain-containing protein n=1 Tax=Salix udensis TaxID=889485 RepID=A0AAD6J9M6_9ROSI|nr:hypothetical protein OIU84_016515 [Salix udensis]
MEMGKKRSVTGEARTSRSHEVAVLKTTKCLNNGLLPRDPQENKDDPHTELWHACAGPLVYVPRVGDKVFYFPQGHMEQVAARMNEDCKMEMPIYDLPYKMLCKVVHVELKAEAGTDEVFACITLLPAAEEDELAQTKLEIPCPCIEKLVHDPLPRNLLHLTQRRTVDSLFQSDMLTKVFLLWTSLSNPQCRNFLPKTCMGLNGAREVNLENFGVGVRRAMKLEKNLLANVLSSHSMQPGILSSASHVISTGSMFTIYFHPWTSPAEFVIPYDQYMKSAEIDYSAGTRFRMLFEGQECTEQSHCTFRIERFKGTVVGLLHSSDEHPNESLLEVLQGQEDRDTGANQFGAFKPPPVSHLTSPLNPDWNYSQIGQDNQLQFWNRCPIYPCPSNNVSFPGGNIARSLSVPNVSCNSGSQKWIGLELKHANEVPLAAPHWYMLFGINLVSNSLELPSPQVATSAVHESHNYVPVTSQSSVSEPSKSTSGVNSEKNNARTVALLLFRVAQRSSNMELYLEDLLISHNSMVYSDDEGDMMQIKDCPWQNSNRQSEGRIHIWFSNMIPRRTFHVFLLFFRSYLMTMKN